uniref:Phosphate transport system permease protein n=1 Tax=Chlorobium chlorochromatii (strain CaD3) TaxID=340177 RepID=Q3ATA2_CHLCH
MVLTTTVIYGILAGLIPLSWIAYRIGSGKAIGFEKTATLHSRPAMHGWYVVATTALPSMLVLVVFALLHVTKLYQAPAILLFAALFVVVAGGFFLGVRTLSPSLRARNHVESVAEWVLIAASCISILTTVGIVFSIVFEAIHFFQLVGFWNFLTGTSWNPDTAFLEGAGRSGDESAKAQFGSVPVFAGTFLITFLALLVAVPVGLYSAIYLSAYASYHFRQVVKPVLEILAGIPTVVYGFFATITVSPLIVEAAEFFGLEASYTNALSPGIVMGIMIIPLVSSLSDDVINAVPQSLREGSLALGMTVSETMKNVILPAALPGVVSAVLLAMSRAIGETMIVVMAAGLDANLTLNPLEGVTTVTVRIVDALTGDQEFNSPATLSAYGLGFVLLIVTLILNVGSSVVVRRFRERYE